MVIGLIDILVLITVVLSVLFALYRGLVRELLGISSWILAGFAALYSYAPVQPLMGYFIENEKIAGIVGSCIVALIVLVVMTILNAHITGKLRNSSLSGLDRILGFVFGVLRAGLLIALVYIGASMILSDHQLKKLEAENVSIPYIQQMAHAVEKVIPEGVKKDLKPYEQGKLKDHQVQKIGKKIQKNLKEEIKQSPINYKEDERKSLDDMVKQIVVEEGELDD